MTGARGAAPLVIRPLAEEDWPAVHAIHDRARPQELEGSCDPRAFVPLADDPELADLRAARIVVAEREGEVIGFAASRDDYLGWLYVDPAHQRSGAGRALLAEALAGMGPRAWTLVLDGNLPARRLYEREGFAAVREVAGDNRGYPCTAIRMERHGLDPAIGLAEYDALRAEPRRWSAALRSIVNAHGLGDREMHIHDEGSNLIASVGPALFLKLFPPCLRGQFESERATLRHLAGRVPFEIPELLVEGERSRWPYLIISRVEGESLETAWSVMDEDSRLAVLREIGAAIRALQQVPVGPLAALEPEWCAFIGGQVDRAAARHQRTRLAPHLQADLARYLAATETAVPLPPRTVILTGEFTPENLLVRRDRDSGRWSLAGVIDFGDVMTGHPEYDLLGPGVFLCEGRRDRLRALLEGYGLEKGGARAGLATRLTRLLVLHRYSNLPVQIRIAGWEGRVRDWNEVEALLWPIDPVVPAPPSGL